MNGTMSFPITGDIAFDLTTTRTKSEQCKPGDLLVVGCTADNTDGMFGELLATSLKARGVVGLVIDAGCRDVKALKEGKFPLYHSKARTKAAVLALLGGKEGLKQWLLDEARGAYPPPAPTTTSLRPCCFTKKFPVTIGMLAVCRRVGKANNYPGYNIICQIG